jgi:hypothetical protein
VLIGQKRLEGAHNPNLHFKGEGSQEAFNAGKEKGCQEGCSEEKGRQEVTQRGAKTSHGISLM